MSLLVRRGGATLSPLLLLLGIRKGEVLATEEFCIEFECAMIIIVAVVVAFPACEEFSTTWAMVHGHV
jgi:hypothetical protein